MALGHLEPHVPHPQGLPRGLAPPIRRCGKGGYRLGSAVWGLLPQCVAVGAVLQGMLARVSVPSLLLCVGLRLSFHQVPSLLSTETESDAPVPPQRSAHAWHTPQTQ